MKINEPKAYYLEQSNDEVTHIAKCARICYANENHVGNENYLCNFLLKNRHYSMLRHVGVYYIIPYDVGFFVPSKYGSYMNIHRNEGFVYVSTNRQCANECMSDYTKYEISYSDALKHKEFIEQKMIYLTFICNSQIAISREYNRKSPNAIAERSTRYVDFIRKVGLCFSKPHWLNHNSLYRGALARLLMFGAQCAYRIARSKFGLNLKQEDARYFLPLGIESKIVYTYTIKDWEYIINVRLWDYTGKAHPDAKELASLILGEIIKTGYHIKPYE